MDVNKLKVLKQIEYKLVECCDLCIYGDFKQGQDFGTCKKFLYKHLKHTGEKRKLSIHKLGICNDYGKMMIIHQDFFNIIKGD